jgi:endonuclease I
MNKIILIITLVLSISGFAQSGAPSPYYNGFNWNLTGNAMKTALATKITTTHSNILTYAEAENAIKVADLDPTNATNANVLLLYGFSNTICPSSTADDKDHRTRSKNSDGGGALCEWNREHTYAKSLGTPNLGETGPGADAHHLRACDVQRNSDRGSEKFVTGSGNSGSVAAGWYPGDEWKGDVARMMMYMYLRYGSTCLPSNVSIGTPVSSDTAMIQLLLDWNAQDAVSQVEINRNTYLGTTSNTYGQGNRNPFIDNPYLATIIWGGQVATNNWPTVFLATDTFELTSSVSIYPNPSTESKINIETETNLDQIELITINGQVIQQIKNPVSQNKIYTLDNLSKGFYFLKLSSNKQSTTKKLIVN